MSIAILAILLSGVASSLISTTRSASVSERRVAATAAMSELHEEFQSLPFESAGILEDELDDLTALGARFEYDPAVASDEFEFDGREGVIVELDCLPDDDTCRRRVPEALIEEGTAGERDAYRFYQVVTWVDRSGDGDPDTKRLTTIAEWAWLGETRTETFESERTLADVVTPTEAAPALVVSAPGFADVDLETHIDEDSFDAGDLAESIPISVNFNVPGATGVEVTVTRLAVTDPVAPEVRPTFSGGVDETFALSPESAGATTTFVGAIPSGVGPFELGSLIISARGTVDSQTITGQASIQLVDAASADPTLGPVGVSSPQASPSTIRVQNTKFSCPLTVSAFVTGLTADDYSVTAVYTGSGGGFQDTIILLPVSGEANITPSGWTFQQVLGTASSHGFSGNGGTTHSGTFVITATRSGEGAEDSATDTTPPVTFQYSGNVSC